MDENISNTFLNNNLDLCGYELLKNQSIKKKEQIIIIGAGITGAVLSAYLARQGFDVAVYDALPDPCLPVITKNRSINLTLCERGINVLKEIGLDKIILEQCVPLKGRMIHKLDEKISQLYGNNEESLYSISRLALIRTLISSIRSTSTVKFYFNEKCEDIDINGKILTFKNTVSCKSSIVTADLIFGADGAWSKVREVIKNRLKDKFLLEFKEHIQVYKELILREDHGNWILENNFLHLWPREYFMLMGFPNKNKTFTLSLHFPKSGKPISLENLCNLTVEKLFKDNFHDVSPFIADSLSNSFYDCHEGKMYSIKCYPWVLTAPNIKIALIGDAAHTMFPYYGQGANCGLEDCLVLMNCYKKHSGNWEKALYEYQRIRKLNSDIITDIAEKHFNILADKVCGDQYQLSEKVGLAVQRVMPQFRTLHYNISFTLMTYEEALFNEKHFQELINELIKIKDIKMKLDSVAWLSICKAVIEKVSNQNGHLLPYTNHSHGSLFRKTPMLFFKTNRENKDWQQGTNRAHKIRAKL